jgi:hypothetical protein
MAPRTNPPRCRKRCEYPNRPLDFLSLVLVLAVMWLVLRMHVWTMTRCRPLLQRATALILHRIRAPIHFSGPQQQSWPFGGAFLTHLCRDDERVIFLCPRAWGTGPSVVSCDPSRTSTSYANHPLCSTSCRAWGGPVSGHACYRCVLVQGWHHHVLIEATIEHIDTRRLALNEVWRARCAGDQNVLIVIEIVELVHFEPPSHFFSMPRLIPEARLYVLVEVRH